MPFNQTYEEESGDADFDSFKTAPWDAGGTQRDEIHESMCRAWVHNIDGLTTKNTECVFTTNRLLATNYPRLKMTPGEYDASYGGTRIGGDLHDTVAISEGNTRRKDEDILRRSAVCDEVDIPADMNCTVVELSDVTILRRRSPRGQDSAEHQECCISISNTAVKLNDVVFCRLRLPRTEVFAEGMEEKCIVPRIDTGSSEQEDRSFCRPKPPWRVAFTEQDMNCSDIKGDPGVSEPCDRLYRRRSLSPNRARTEVGGLIHKQIMLFRRTNFPPNSVALWQ